MWEQHRQQRVAGFVSGRDPLLRVADDHRPSLRAHQDLVLRELEVDHPHGLAVVARGVERRLVHEVRQVGTREAGRATRQHRGVDII